MSKVRARLTAVAARGRRPSRPSISSYARSTKCDSKQTYFDVGKNGLAKAGLRPAISSFHSPTAEPDGLFGLASHLRTIHCQCASSSVRANGF